MKRREREASRRKQERIRKQHGGHAAACEVPGEALQEAEGQRADAELSDTAVDEVERAAPTPGGDDGDHHGQDTGADEHQASGRRLEPRPIEAVEGQAERQHEHPDGQRQRRPRTRARSEGEIAVTFEGQDV